MPAPTPRKPLNRAPAYPVPGAARRALVGIGAAALLGGGLLAGCGLDDSIPDPMQKLLNPIIATQPDAGQPPGPDAGDFFGGGAPYPYETDAG